MAVSYASGLLLTGLLLRRLPTRLYASEKIPSDWKIWARVILGIQATGQLNQALPGKQPPWLGAMESVAAITLLMHGLNARSMAQAAVLMPWVAGMVQLSSSVSQSLGDTLQTTWHVPRWLPRLAVSVASMGLGIKLTPALFKLLAKQHLLKPWSSLLVAGSSQGALAGGMTTTCARGCTPGGLICMSELGEFLGGFGHWWNSHNTSRHHNPSTADQGQEEFLTS